MNGQPVNVGGIGLGFLLALVVFLGALAFLVFGHATIQWAFGLIAALALAFLVSAVRLR